MSYYYLVLLILVTIMFLVSEARLVRAGRKENALSIVVIFLITVVHFVITWYKMVYEPEYNPTGWVQRVDVITTSILIPLIYLYICHQFGVKLLCATTYCIFGSLILCLFTRIYLVIDDVVPQTDLTPTNLYIFYSGKVLWKWNVYEMCLPFQAIIMGFKIWQQYLRMNELRWKLTSNSNRLFMICLTVLIYTLIVAFVKDSWWNPVTICIYITGYGVFVSALLQMVSVGYDLQPVVDVENNEPQYLEVHPKFEKMNAEFERLVNEEKVYLNSHLTIEAMAKMLNTNRTYVSKMVKETYGESFTNVINGYRLKHAKQYIHDNPDMKLEVVAMESGFGSVSSFTKVFKDTEGVTPSQWK